MNATSARLTESPHRPQGLGYQVLVADDLVATGVPTSIPQSVRGGGEPDRRRLPDGAGAARSTLEEGREPIARISDQVEEAGSRVLREDLVRGSLDHGRLIAP